MSQEPEIHLLLELESEVARWRRRSMFLLSVILHGLLATLIMVSPNLLRRGADLIGIEVEPVPQRERTFLWLPPEVLRRLQEPPPDTDILSDQDRRAQGRSPLIDPFGNRLPYSPGNTPLPEIAGGGPPELTPPMATPPAPAGDSGLSALPRTENKEESSLRLMEVPTPGSSGDSRFRVPQATPGEAIQQSLEAAARGRAVGPLDGPGDSMSQFRNLSPNFSTEAPIILSDTRGVDFGPYLARVVMVVRRNWYAVIPVTARLGQKGRVAIVFAILKDGSVPELRLVASSGSEPLDRAAIAAIRASNPFPPLPEAFTGENLVLQFIFLYNMGYAP